MKLIRHSIIGLFIISVVFLASNSFAQRFDPFAAGLAPEEKAMFKALYGVGVPLSISLYGQPSGSEEPCEASTMISSELRDQRGGYLAEISDLVIAPENGRVSDVVLTRIQGIGAKEVVVPFSTVSKTQHTIFLYNAPEEVYQFLGESPYRSWGFNQYSKQKAMGDLTARKLIGALVRTSKGEDLGRIEDLIVDHMNGSVVNLVVSSKDGKLVKVPFSALSKSGEAFILKST